jgi:4'-phosphopantetheinyl transferase
MRVEGPVSPAPTAMAGVDIWTARMPTPKDGSARAFLRHVLATYVADGTDLTLRETASGKPVFACPTLAGLHFNLSHSADVVFVAVSRTGPVGIDVERISPTVDWNGIARRFFHHTDVDWLFAQPPDCQLEAFFTLWTRKEAFAKARGGTVFEGLGVPMATPAAGCETIAAPEGFAAACALQRGVGA